MYEDAFTPLEPLDELDPVAQPPPIDVEAMLAQLEHPVISLRIQATQVFCDLKDPRAVAGLLNLLVDPCPLVRVSAAYALGRNVNAAAIETLIGALRQDWNGYVRKGVVWALGNGRDGRAFPALIEALSGDITAVRLWAASALGQLAHSAAMELPASAVVDALVLALHSDPIAAVRSNAAWALGKVGEVLSQGGEQQQLLRALSIALNSDPDLGVQDDVQAALCRLAVDPLAEDADLEEG